MLHPDFVSGLMGVEDCGSLPDTGLVTGDGDLMADGEDLTFHFPLALGDIACTLLFKGRVDGEIIEAYVGGDRQDDCGIPPDTLLVGVLVDLAPGVEDVVLEGGGNFADIESKLNLPTDGWGDPPDLVVVGDSGDLVDGEETTGTFLTGVNDAVVLALGTESKFVFEDSGSPDESKSGGDTAGCGSPIGTELAAVMLSGAEGPADVVPFNCKLGCAESVPCILQLLFANISAVLLLIGSSEVSWYGSFCGPSMCFKSSKKTPW